ncbi:hypothetical protein BX616_002687 [Lobosporangium transversale]|uniref:Uncharacterized protein n=1 Tax=Lobosporangium transversale TaxID=64571 RepID=A0A1Y2GGZ3_9FUNG|nr:hypothetical protein BCR41DRAFT_423762 [Lobosporangium transversale]KAF9900109.1 hypothetical protein BX616_002687 [Lobosporangium transversale]ORZ10627.1 hypothetical protein BCR41DRAFT_423762 [Lobosporangium transversale]|eukprot:XP_021879348.1 hypothetical protein BCR41DRAFT_423762 [Lobosporangium transversale]
MKDNQFIQIMLAEDHAPIPKASNRNSFHGESSSNSLSSQHSRTNARKRLTQQSFTTIPAAATTSSSAVHPFSFLTRTGSAHPRHRSMSIASGTSGGTASTARLLTTSTTSPETTVLTKEKEFMANTRILAMSNLIESFTSTPHPKQGFYGKQLKIIGSTSSSVSATGAELDIAVKIHVIEDIWTTCPLLPTSTILHRWKVTYLGTADQKDSDDFGPQLTNSKADKDTSWVQATVERTETISPAPSPISDQPSKKRPLSMSSVSSLPARNATPQTHIGVLSNALCFVANRSGDYLVQLSIHVPFVLGTGSRSIHLPHIPKCRSNFLKFQVQSPQSLNQENGINVEARANTDTDVTHCDDDENFSNGFEFNVYPILSTLDEAHLNPESDDDAQFWLEVQELLEGSGQFVEKLIASDNDKGSAVKNQAEETRNGTENVTKPEFEIAGCFAPSSSLHVSWIPRDAVDFVQEVEQDMIVHISGMPDQTKSSTLLQDRKRKDPEESHATDQADQIEELIEYQHLDLDDCDLAISAESTLTLSIQKLGWRQPFMDFSIELEDIKHGYASDVSLLDIAGDAVQDWESLVPDLTGQTVPLYLDNLDKDSSTDHDHHPSPIYRVWFFTGTEGTTTVQISIRVGQAVCVGYGKDILCNIPKIHVHGATWDKGRIHVHASSDLMIQRFNARLLETSHVDGHSQLEEGLSGRHPSILHFQYQSTDYRLAVVAQRYQAVARIARIERVRAEIGIGGQRQPGFARITLSNVVLPQYDDPYLRVYQLDGAEIWNVLVDGKPCGKSIMYMDRKSAGQRTVMIPIPEESLNGNDLHQIEISYGFNTFDCDQEDMEDETLGIKLVVPGFSLPVGEYVVVASLPKLARGIDYDEPSGDFEVISNLGKVGQRRTITYGAYMIRGRPRLSIRTVRATAETWNVNQIEHEGLERAQDVAGGYGEVSGSLEQIGRAASAVVAHDPQQPPFNAGVVVIQQTSQRHPQQPLELQNPQTEQRLDGEILPVLSTRTNGLGSGVEGGATTSNLAPQVGSPALIRSGSGSSQMGLWWSKPLSFEQVPGMMRKWWKPVMASIAAVMLMIMIANAAAFRETKSTSLDLVGIPAWQRPFVAIGRLWRDSSMSPNDRQTNPFTSMWEEWGEQGEQKKDDLYMETVVTVTTTKEAGPRETEEAMETTTTQDLEIRSPPEGGHKGDGGGYEEYDGQNGTRPDASGLGRIVQFLKKLVHDLKH